MGVGLFHGHAATNHVHHASNARQENPLRPSRSPYLDMLQACRGEVLQRLLLVLGPRTCLHHLLAQVVDKKARAPASMRVEVARESLLPLRGRP